MQLNPKKNSNKRIQLFLLLIALITFIGVFLFGYIQSSKNQIVQKQELAAETLQNELEQVTEADLAPYDGSDISKPIYVGMNGYVYDVTGGREFYEPGGPYHYLVGKDSSTELNLVGGDIIARKYPIIAILKE
ncbi:hypothetical protein KC717_05640 [Candidatus Dojkabacteria bacterium]|uniref:Cytochrome b5 heme-binding domain-containing protein n=1 Tax=Candidatus Dojkabacteria bacterium TaxID=2099670 RepID=A0A955L9P5_9BACT|nr:hypothetical protein [Candidatus Dojkabacteria bacterium]